MRLTTIFKRQKQIQFCLFPNAIKKRFRIVHLRPMTRDDFSLSGKSEKNKFLQTFLALLNAFIKNSLDFRLAKPMASVYFVKRDSKFVQIFVFFSVDFLFSTHCIWLTMDADANNLTRGWTATSSNSQCVTLKLFCHRRRRISFNAMRNISELIQMIIIVECHAQCILINQFEGNVFVTKFNFTQTIRTRKFFDRIILLFTRFQLIAIFTDFSASYNKLRFGWLKTMTIGRRITNQWSIEILAENWHLSRITSNRLWRQCLCSQRHIQWHNHQWYTIRFGTVWSVKWRNEKIKERKKTKKKKMLELLLRSIDIWGFPHEKQVNIFNFTWMGRRAKYVKFCWR